MSGTKAAKADAIPRDLMTRAEVATRVGVCAGTIGRWCESGEWPLPHAVLGQTHLFRRDVIEHWLKCGEWPEGAKFTRGAGAGRVRPGQPV